MSEAQSASDAIRPADALRVKVVVPILLIVAILAAVTLLIVGNATKQPLPGNAAANRTTTLDGLKLSPILPAPPLDTLRNYNGMSFNLATDRGKAVFVTFLYTHCPDICPLIASHLHSAYATMSPALRRRVAIVAVSVDPHGDTPGTVAAFVQQHELTGEASYLIGSASQLVPVWKAWFVGSQRDVSRPDLVNHSALVYGISARGKLTAIYPANFKPSDIVHDTAALLGS